MNIIKILNNIAPKTYKEHNKDKLRGNTTTKKIINL